MKAPRPCLNCGVVFTPDHGNAKSCSPECMVARERSIKRERQRRIRNTPPERFAENIDRDPVAMLERKRARYRRGQRAHRARVADATP